MSAHHNTRAWTRPTRRVLLLGATVVGLVGCGGGGSSSHGATGTAGTTATSTAQAAPTRGTPTVVAGIPFAGNLTLDRHGGLWVGSGAGGKTPSDGVWYVPPGGRPRQVIKGLPLPFGLAWVGNRLYVGHGVTPTSGAVTLYEGFDGQRFSRHHDVLRGLPIGHHSVGTIVAGPQGRLFVGVGAVRDNSGPPGRVLSFGPDGGQPLVEATGLRSAFGLAFAGPQLLVTDNGRDDLGRSRPRDELNEFDPRGSAPDFGFPGCYDQGGSACAGKRPPFVTFAPHSSPTGVGVKGSVAYVAENGSSFSHHPTGNAVVRVDLRTGDQSVFWRSPVEHDPSGAAVGPDGNLYVTLYASGKVVRFPL
jgi:glucose/arabinose dehydrogenase